VREQAETHRITHDRKVNRRLLEGEDSREHTVEERRVTRNRVRQPCAPDIGRGDGVVEAALSRVLERFESIGVKVHPVAEVLVLSGDGGVVLDRVVVPATQRVSAMTKRIKANTYWSMSSRSKTRPPFASAPCEVSPSPPATAQKSAPTLSPSFQTRRHQPHDQIRARKRRRTLASSEENRQRDVLAVTW
jgi:hypothetical protein